MFRQIKEWLKSLFAPVYAEQGNHFCPVCGYKTIERDTRWPQLCQWSICHVCFWEDDDWFEGGGANEPSLAEARAAFLKYGAIEERFVCYVKPPNPSTPRIEPSPAT